MRRVDRLTTHVAIWDSSTTSFNDSPRVPFDFRVSDPARATGLLAESIVLASLAMAMLGLGLTYVVRDEIAELTTKASWAAGLLGKEIQNGIVCCVS